MSDAASDYGTVVHRSDVSTVPPMFQPAWKATPARDRFHGMGGDMFSPLKLQQMFHTPSPSSRDENEAPSVTSQSLAPVPSQREFTFRARNVPSSTPMPPRPSSHGRPAPPPSTPGGPPVPLRLIHMNVDARIRSGLEQLAEEKSREASRDESSPMPDLDLRESKRMRLGSYAASERRFPLAYRHSAATPRAPSSGSFPRSILKGTTAVGETPRGPASRSISFADQLPSRVAELTPRTARLDHVLEELEHMNLTQSVRARPAPLMDTERSMISSASFRLTKDKLVELLTDVAPWEPDWQTLTKVDLRARRLESCIGLGEHLPNVEEVWMDHNLVAFAMGLPPSVRVLTASHNRLSELASFEHLQRLEVLDVSHNELTSLLPFQHLPHLRELRADHNQIRDLQGLGACASLHRVSLAHNALRGAVELHALWWPSMEHLTLSNNAITHLDGLERLAALRTLDVEANELTELRLGRTLPQLRVLRLSDNAQFDRLDVACAPRLRILYADRCRLRCVQALEAAHELRSLSLRQQSVRLALPLPLPPKLERLFLAGNALGTSLFVASRLSELVYLELAGCQLAALPTGLLPRTPALRTLNVDHNPLTTFPPLDAWRRLKRLSAVGCRLARLEDIVHAVHGLRELCVLDARANPCTLSLYAPLVLPSEGGASSAAGAHEYGPPVPHPAIVQPDASAAYEQAAEARWRAAQALADRSQFHKRTMLLPPEPAAPTPAEAPSTEGARATAMFRAADARFCATLPKATLHKRQVYRGLCGMACKALTWLDGLEVDEHDVRRAERQLRHVE